MTETKRVLENYRRGNFTLGEVEKKLLRLGYTAEEAQAIIYDLIADLCQR